jgi:DNA-directed RNA polymerase subunit RPC12/RpoP
MTHRVCEACGFENAESGRACRLCGARATDEYALIAVAPDDATPAPRKALEITREYTCSSCTRDYTVSYERQPAEPEQPVPVACPHCWQTTEVNVGRAAADGQDYHVEKA